MKSSSTDSCDVLLLVDELEIETLLCFVLPEHNLFFYNKLCSRRISDRRDDEVKKLRQMRVRAK